MSITIKRNKNRHAPLYTCAVCGHAITDATLANLLWIGDELTDGADTEALIAHKGRCTVTADQEHGTHLYSTELTVAIYRLAANSGMNLDDLKRAKASHAMLNAVGRSL